MGGVPGAGSPRRRRTTTATICSNSTELVSLVFARPPYIFTDVVPNHPLLGADGGTDFSPWINALYAAGITSGCGISPLRYCPAAP